MATTAIMTGPEFDALPYEEGRRWELVGGELIPVPSTTLEHQAIMQEILFALMAYFRSRPEQGRAFTDVEFALDADHRVRPDILILLRDRLAAIDMQKVPVPGAPDIAVEVISPSERSFDTQQKSQAYLRHGTQEVWQVYPKSKTIVVHRAGGSTTLSTGERLETPLLPGFALDVNSLF
ncbi:MAG TPA: Uma2 family endonuclease [Bryobacteraceae bacterium]|jgi:Uma2 family endonuclease|nr:Uma2 family endonuclease [Bryobacteraceae bacterium]